MINLQGDDNKVNINFSAFDSTIKIPVGKHPSIVHTSRIFHEYIQELFLMAAHSLKIDWMKRHPINVALPFFRWEG